MNVEWVIKHSTQNLYYKFENYYIHIIYTKQTGSDPWQDAAIWNIKSNGRL